MTTDSFSTQRQIAQHCVDAEENPPLHFAWRWEGSSVVLSPLEGAPRRKVLVIGFAGVSAELFLSWKKSRFGGHGLWGCLELAALGYEVILPRCIAGSPRGLSRLMWDLQAVRDHLGSLGPHDIVYCNHNCMLWTPLARLLGRTRVRLVGLLYACEPLPLGRAYDAIIGMTKVAVAKAKRDYPGKLVAHIPWGIDLTENHHCYRAYDPKWGLSCGVTGRDYAVIREAFTGLNLPLKVCARGRAPVTLPPCAEQHSHVTPEFLTGTLYHHAAYVLVTLPVDRTGREAIGCTNVLEAMAMGRPVIKTRTGALDGDIDVVNEGIGLYVPPHDAAALADAVRSLVDDPHRAAGMGRHGRELAERYYNMERFGRDLHQCFEGLN